MYSPALHFFNKNITFGFTLFWFKEYASFSGQAPYNDWYMSFYNVFFTSLPIIALGVFDQDVSAKLCLKVLNCHLLKLLLCVLKILKDQQVDIYNYSSFKLRTINTDFFSIGPLCYQFTYDHLINYVSFQLWTPFYNYYMINTLKFMFFVSFLKVLVLPLEPMKKGVCFQWGSSIHSKHDHWFQMLFNVFKHLFLQFPVPKYICFDSRVKHYQLNFDINSPKYSECVEFSLIQVFLSSTWFLLFTKTS